MPMPATSTKTTKLATSLIDEYALLGWRAMLTEVNLSPKTGLVHRINCGRTKIGAGTFHRSALAIRAGYPVSLNLVPVVRKWHQKRYPRITPNWYGLQGDMFRATAGVNTHKGSIFSLGLLCVAIAVCFNSTNR
ncbi:triphosphoribosyl-dephospho-CoA synthase [Shigella boydii]